MIVIFTLSNLSTEEQMARNMLADTPAASNMASNNALWLTFTTNLPSSRLFRISTTTRRHSTSGSIGS
ncbi:unnamed protein product, partial [Nesidiocoris tenuis]